MIYWSASAALTQLYRCSLRCGPFKMAEEKADLPCYRIILLGEPGVGMTTYTLHVKQRESIVSGPDSRVQTAAAEFKRVLDGDAIKVRD